MPRSPFASPPARRLAAARAGLMAAVAIGLVTTAPTGHAATTRADLTVTKGSVAVRGGQLVGVFTVRNAGARAAPRTTASLSVIVRDRLRRFGKFGVPAIAAGRSATVAIDVSVPAGLTAGKRPLRACANSDRRLREHSTADNCRTLGTLITERRAPTPPSEPAPVALNAAVSAPPTPGATPTPVPVSTPVPTPVPSTVPSDPLTSQPDADGVYAVSTPSVRYLVRPMSGYDQTHRTPTTLLVGMHGCGGDMTDFMEWAVAPYTNKHAPNQPYVGLSLGGRDGQCWDNDADQSLVLAAIADAKRHFNVNPRRVVLMGYSSGGLLAYRTAFHHSGAFAGVLAMASSPFWEGSGPSSLAAATTRFPIVHIAHTKDETFPIADVRAQLGQLRDQGFPVTAEEVPGTHAASGADAEDLIAAMNASTWLAATG
ncbi:MAG: hypothetical protein PGN13_03050 [Patulibacter minatonensis]